MVVNVKYMHTVIM